jgi:hypothetical protein
VAAADAPPPSDALAIRAARVKLEDFAARDMALMGR